jgi:hypothetical protein
MAKPILIFSHIPKTGGLTMRKIIDQHFAPHQIYKYPAHHEARTLSLVPPSKISHIRCVYGHCRFGVHRHFDRPFQYITMLRDPLKRIISSYYFIRSSPSNKLHEKVKKMSLEEYVFSRDSRINLPLHNHQTRFISGKNDPDIKLAMENIRKHYVFIGITEMYPESVFMLNRLMGWKHKPYSKENITKNKPKKIPLSDRAIKHIKEQNALDYQIYEYCKEQLVNQIKHLPDPAKERLERFVKLHH